MGWLATPSARVGGGRLQVHVTHRGLGAIAAALIALLMLSYASVQSTVMQAAMGAPAGAGSSSHTDPDPMAGMVMPGPAQAEASRSAHAAKPGHANPAACPYCSAAAHLPILGAAAPLRAPSVIRFAALRVAAGHGPRGPPARQPRARGPPSDPLTL